MVTVFHLLCSVRVIENEIDTMPRNRASEARKRRIVLLLEDRLGPLHNEHQHRSDWHSSEGGLVEVFITDSKFHFEHQRWWDMALNDIKALAECPSGFIIFILGSATNFMVFPAKDLMSQLPYYQGRSTEDGRYHFHLNRNTFVELPNWNLRPYAENLSIIPAKSK